MIRFWILDFGLPWPPARGSYASESATASIEYRYKGYMSGIPAFWNDSSKSGLGQGFRIEERNFIGLIFWLPVMAEYSVTQNPQLGTPHT